MFANTPFATVNTAIIRSSHPLLFCKKMFLQKISQNSQDNKKWFRQRCFVENSAKSLVTSWRRLQKVLKESWRCLEDVFAKRLEDVSQRRRGLEDVSWAKLTYWSWSRRLQAVSWTRMRKANMFVLTLSWRRVISYRNQSR